MGFEEVVIERNLNKWNVLVASLIAGFDRLGVLSQAVVNKDMQVVADKLARFFKVKGNVPQVDPSASFEENLRRIIEFLDRELELAGESSVEAEGDQLTFKVVGSTCHFCPKGVGEAELPGTACPYPALIMEFANKFLPDDQKVEVVQQGRNYLKKEGGVCRIIFKKK